MKKQLDEVLKIFKFDFKTMIFAAHVKNSLV